LAERWFKREGQLAGYRDRPPLIDEWHFTDGDSARLRVQVITYPHRVDRHTSIGMFSLAFVDTETLLVTLRPRPCGMAFHANLDHTQTDRREGILRLTGDIRLNISYTHKTTLLQYEASAITAGTQAVRMSFEVPDEQRAMLLNITPRLGFNRWVLQPGAALGAAAHAVHDAGRQRHLQVLPARDWRRTAARRLDFWLVIGLVH
jgi:hypothetical protein